MECLGAVDKLSAVCFLVRFLLLSFVEEDVMLCFVEEGVMGHWSGVSRQRRRRVGTNRSPTLTLHLIIDLQCPIL